MKWDEGTLSDQMHASVRRILAEKVYPRIKHLERLEALEGIYERQIAAVEAGYIVVPTRTFGRLDFTLENWLHQWRPVRPEDLASLGQVGSAGPREDPAFDDLRAHRRAPRLVPRDVKKRAGDPGHQADPPGLAVHPDGGSKIGVP